MPSYLRFEGLRVVASLPTTANSRREKLNADGQHRDTGRQRSGPEGESTLVSQRGRREYEEASRGNYPGAVTTGTLIWTTQG